MFVRISIAAAIAFFAFAPSTSLAATKKKPTHVSDSCLGGGCVYPNPNRTINQCGGDPVSCYKRARTHKKNNNGQSSNYTIVHRDLV